MTTKKPNYEKLYLLFEPNLADLKEKRQEFGHPEIRIGSGYGSSGPYWQESGRLTYQVNVDIGQDQYRNGDAYAGYLNCEMVRAPTMGKLVEKASAKGHELAPAESDPFKTMLVGLRALGYMRARLASDSSQIVSTT